MESIKTYKLFVNFDENAKSVASQVSEELSKRGLIEVDGDNEFQLAIAVGGDGSFLRMVKQCNFNAKIMYVGVNAGTLGFLQEIKPTKLAEFADRLVAGKYTTEEVGLQKTMVTSKDGCEIFYSINEIVIRDKNLCTSKQLVKIDDVVLENFAGDGLLISTSLGSTAYNSSLGGSIVYGQIHTLQITPVAPLYNKAYKVLRNSIVCPEDKVVKVVPDKSTQNLLISIDGVNKVFDEVEEITTTIADVKIKLLRMFKFDYAKVIRDKFLV